MNTNLILRARILLVVVFLFLPVILVLSRLASDLAIWRMACLLLWAVLMGVTVGHLANLKRLERAIGALRARGMSEAEVKTLLNERITLP